MVRTNGSVAALAALVFVLGGCSPDRLAYRKVADDPVVLEVLGPVAVDVQSFAGDVIIETDPLLSEATVSVVRETSHGFKRTKEGKASLEEIGYDAKLVPGQLGQMLRVRTWSSHAEPHFQRASLHISLPAVDGLTVRTRGGDVSATGIEGTVQIETSEGNVRVMTDLPMTRAVTIVTTEGDIDYRVRGESTGVFDCEAIRGAVIQRVHYGRLKIHTGTDHDTLLATLNEGRNLIQLRTVGGEIRVAVVSNPTHVGSKIVDP